jgi:predicted DNA-binding protein with PD1-like motif
MLSLVLAAALCAEVKKTVVVKPSPDPKDDAKPNSAAVPEVSAMSGKLDRVVVLRFKYQADLLAGIEKAVKDHKIKNGVILSGIGSVRNSHYHGVSNRDFPSKNIYVKDDSTPADILSMNGYILDGRVHAHFTLADDEKAFGGHIEAGNNVFTFAVVTIGVFSEGLDLSRADDKSWR